MPFIVFEGLDGSGKSTLLKRVQTLLEQKQIPHVVTREPGGTPLAEEIRALLLKKGGDEPVAFTEILLYEASRAQHVAKLIRPALAAGKWVLCDRFSASTFAFQCGGRALDKVHVKAIDQFATQGLTPDLTVLLDLSVDQSATRKKNFELDRLESENGQFHQNVRATYLELAKNDTSWLVLNSGRLSPEGLFESLCVELRRRQWLNS